MLVQQSLKSLSNYPIPSAIIEEIADGVGLTITTELTPELREDKQFKRAQARVYLYLSEAPNVTQGGITYSFSIVERKHFRDRANTLLGGIGDTVSDVEYGYICEDL
jgi:hypothetical protein